MALFKRLSATRIPTLLGITVLILGLGAGLYLVGQATLIPRASVEETPREIKITNVSENSFTVSWITEEATLGFVRFGTAENDLTQTLGDDRDQLSGSVGTFTTHHTTIRNLKPQTSYFFKLGSGSRRVLYDDSGKAYTVRTPQVLGTPPPADTVYGTVVTPTQAPAEGALVYLTLPNSTPLSTLVKTNGNWAVSLSTSRTSDLTAYVQYDPQGATLELFVQGGSGQTATAVTTTSNDSPVPPIVLGQTHDFRTTTEATESASLPPGATEEEVTEATGSSTFSVTPLGDSLPETSTFELDILNPEVPGETVTTTQPEIFGTSPKNITLTIMVESPATFTDEIEVGEDGLWQWSPPDDLTPGTHTVTVSYTDEHGILQKLSRTFVVFAAEGTSPAFEATPSASATPSAAPRVSQPSTASGVPTAGILTPTIVLFILGLGLFAGGLFWQLKSKATI